MNLSKIQTGLWGESLISLSYFDYRVFRYRVIFIPPGPIEGGDARALLDIARVAHPRAPGILPPTAHTSVSLCIRGAAARRWLRRLRIGGLRDWPRLSHWETPISRPCAPAATSKLKEGSVKAGRKRGCLVLRI